MAGQPQAQAPTTLNSFALPVLLLVPAARPHLLLAACLPLALTYVTKATVDTRTHQAGNNIFECWGAWFYARTNWLNKYKLGSWPGAPKPRF